MHIANQKELGLNSWREQLWSTYVRLESNSDDDAFYGRVREYLRGDCSLSCVDSTVQVTERAASHIRADGQEVFLFAFQIDGEGWVEQDGRIAETLPGDFTVYDSTRPYRLMFEGPFRQLVFRVSQSTLQYRIQGLRAHCARKFSATQGTGGVTLDFLKSLARRARETDKQDLQAMTSVANDLILGCVLAQTSDLSPRHRLYERLRSSIADAVRDPAFGPTELAMIAGVSPRSLRRMCAESGSTPAQLILDVRLQGAKRDLMRHGNARLSITDIALNWGFSDISHFNRSFKTLFGITPSGCRRLA